MFLSLFLRFSNKEKTKYSTNYKYTATNGTKVYYLKIKSRMI